MEYRKTEDERPLCTEEIKPTIANELEETAGILRQTDRLLETMYQLICGDSNTECYSEDIPINCMKAAIFDNRRLASELLKKAEIVYKELL